MGVERLTEKQVRNILLLRYSHHDYEWCCTRAWHKWRYIKCYCDVLDIMRQDPTFTWCIDNVVHSWVPFKECCPDRVAEFEQRVREGRIDVINGGVSLARPSRIGEESFIRNMVEGRRYFNRQFGVDDFPLLYCADVACGHSQVPQIADLGGHRYYRFLRPDELLTKKGVPTQFWWQGLDGSKLFVTRGMYGGFFINNEWLHWDVETRWDEIKERFFETWLWDKVIDNLPSDTVLQFVGTDDALPMRDYADRPLKLDDFVRHWNEREEVHMRYTTPTEAYHALAAKEMPTWQGVLDHSELSYDLPVKGDRSMWRMRILLEQLMTQLEKLHVIAEAIGRPYPEQQLREMWDEVFEVTGHAIEWIQDKDNDELYTIAQSVLYRGQVMLRRAVDAITQAVRADDGLQAVLINLNSWQSSRVARFEVTDWQGVSGFDVIDESGRKLPYQIYRIYPNYRNYQGFEYAGVEILVHATVPAMGYCTLRVVPNGQQLQPLVEQTFIDRLPAFVPADAQGPVCFDNGLVQAQFEDGRLLWLRQDGKTVSFRADDGLRFTQLEPANSWISRYDDVVRTFTFEPSGGKVMGNGPMRFEYRAHGTLAGQPATVTYILDHGSRALDVCIETDFREAIEGVLLFQLPTDHYSDVYAHVPFGMEKREFYDDITMDPVTAVTTATNERDFVGQIYARGWCAFGSGGAALAVVSKNCEGYYNYDRPKDAMQLFLNRHMPLQYRTDRWVGECPDSFDGTGKNHFEFSLLFAQGLGCAEDIERYRMERIHPVLAQSRVGFAAAQGADPQQSLYHCPCPHVICSAVYRENGHVTARFFECNGQAVTTPIHLPANTVRVFAVDFNDRPRPDVEVRWDAAQRTATVAFGAFKIVTLHIETEE